MSVHDLSGNVGAFATHTITRRRMTDGTVTAGVPAAPSVATLSMRASVQPVPGRTAERLALGERARDAVTVYVAAGNLTEHDDVTIDAVNYAVIEARDWRAGGAYTEAVCVRRPA